MTQRMKDTSKDYVSRRTISMAIGPASPMISWLWLHRMTMISLRNNLKFTSRCNRYMYIYFGDIDLAD
jgi:hypothetical protein